MSAGNEYAAWRMRSGAMCVDVPRNVLASASESASSLLMPKSVSLTAPSMLMRMFDSLRSCGGSGIVSGTKASGRRGGCNRLLVHNWISWSSGCVACLLRGTQGKEAGWRQRYGRSGVQHRRRCGSGCRDRRRSHPMQPLFVLQVGEPPQRLVRHPGQDMLRDGAHLLNHMRKAPPAHVLQCYGNRAVRVVERAEKADQTAVERGASRASSGPMRERVVAAKGLPCAL